MNVARVQLVAERARDDNGRRYVIRDQDGAYVASLPFRHLCALAAAEQGLVYGIRRRRSWYGMCDEWIESACDLFGIAHGTLWVLEHHKLIRKVTSPGEIARPTLLGRRCLAAVRAAGVETLLTDRLAVAA